MIWDDPDGDVRPFNNAELQRIREGLKERTGSADPGSVLHVVCRDCDFEAVVDAVDESDDNPRVIARTKKLTHRKRTGHTVETEVIDGGE